MNTTLTVDKAGRVVLPKPVRDEMQLRAGDSMELESSEDRIILRPRRGGVGLHQKQGIWAFGVGEPIPAGATDDTLRQIRHERELSFAGTLSTRRPHGRNHREMVLRCDSAGCGAPALPSAPCPQLRVICVGQSKASGLCGPPLG